MRVGNAALDLATMGCKETCILCIGFQISSPLRCRLCS
ncbi:hypothetical protein HU200_003420 [Digitaria exilis]|uniref:Uncharacterized protein n=1 Tax=Digitaria exilis TaxID=1010633 RepID=A0A835KUU1_9POAL|nr:hypothetical protein HU200_003420 [Digitaria exilis]